jgi:hypothetical protein
VGAKIAGLVRDVPQKVEEIGAAILSRNVNA